MNVMNKMTKKNKKSFLRQINLNLNTPSSDTTNSKKPAVTESRNVPQQSDKENNSNVGDITAFPNTSGHSNDSRINEL